MSRLGVTTIYVAARATDRCHHCGAKASALDWALYFSGSRDLPTPLSRCPCGVPAPTTPTHWHVTCGACASHFVVPRVA